MQRGRGRGRERGRGRGGRGRWRGGEGGRWIAKGGGGGDGGTETHDPAAIASAAAQDPAAVASAAAQDPAAVASAAAQAPAAVTAHIYGPLVFGTVTVDILGLSTAGASTPQLSSPQQPLPEEGLMTDLLQYLNKYHSADAKHMSTEKIFSLEIDFRQFKKRGKQLAYLICNGYRNLKDNINATFKSLESFKDYVNRHRRSSKLFVPSEFEHEVADMAPGPQNMLRKLLFEVLNKHKDKLCWGGNWTIDDWEVVDDEELQFDVEADCQKFKARKDSEKDLVKIGEEVLPLFALEVAGGQAGGTVGNEMGVQTAVGGAGGNLAGGHATSGGQGSQAVGAAGSQVGSQAVGAAGSQAGDHAAAEGGQGNQAGGAPGLTKKTLYPPYLHHLIKLLTNTSARKMRNRKYLNDKAYYGWYYSFLLYHPCLLSSKARKNLLKGLHELCVNLQYWRRSKWRKIYRTVFIDWNREAGGLNIRDKVHPLLTVVFWGTNSRKAQSAVPGTPSPSPSPSPSSPAQPAASPTQSPKSDGTASPAAVSSSVAPNQYGIMPYSDSVGDLLKFFHDALRHLYDFTTVEKNGKKHVQLIQHSDEPELFMADMFPYFLPDLLIWIFEMGVMEDEVLEHWNMFKDHWKIN